MKKFCILFLLVLFHSPSLFSNSDEEIKEIQSLISKINDILEINYEIAHKSLPENFRDVFKESGDVETINTIKNTLSVFLLYLKLGAAQKNEADSISFHTTLSTFQAVFMVLSNGYSYFLGDRVITCNEVGTHCDHSMDPTFIISAPFFIASIINSVRQVGKSMDIADQSYRSWASVAIPGDEELKKIIYWLKLKNLTELEEYISLVLIIHSAPNDKVPERLEHVHFGTPEQKSWIARLTKHFWFNSR